MPKAAYVRGQADLSDAILRCRTWGHSWDECFPIDMAAPAYGWRESVRCVRCTTERHRIIHRRTGAVMSVSYYYPDNYLMEPGSGPLERHDLRNTMFDRLKDRLEQAHAIAEQLTLDERPKKATKKAQAAATQAS